MSNPTIKTAIVLAGGFGTRLQHVVRDVPKPMAPVAGKPFLFWLLKYLKHQQIDKVILSVGHLHNTIIDFFGDAFEGMKIIYAIETTALGTGGGIQLAASFVEEEYFFIINGDTFFNVPLSNFSDQHFLHLADLSLALKPMQNFERYGTVVLNSENQITAFREKEKCNAGNINGGVYACGKTFLKSLNLPSAFSFEKEVLEKYVNTKKFYGFVSDTYFIDIGIPDDYQKAQSDVELRDN